MEKEQFEQLLTLWKELNECVKSISYRISGIDNTLDLIKEHLKGK